MTLNKFGKVWSAIVKYVFLLFMTLYVIACTHLFVEKSNLISSFAGVWGLSIVLAVVGISLVAVASKKYPTSVEKLKKLSLGNSLSRQALVICGIPFLIKVLLIALFPIRQDLGDISVYINISMELVKNGLVKTNALYAAQYPHLFAFGLFLAPASLVGNGSYYFYEIYIALIQGISSFMVFMAMRNLGQRDIISLIYAYLPSQIFLCMAVTHENALLFFSALGLFIYSSIFSNKAGKTTTKILGVLSIGLLVALITRVNSMGLVLIITVVVSCASVLSKENWKLIILAIGATLLLNSFVSGFMTDYQYSVSDTKYYPTGKAFLSNLYIGANYESEGRYDGDTNRQMDTYVKSVLGDEYTLDQYYGVIGQKAAEEWRNLVSRPSKLVVHLINKFSNVWSGTHYSIEEAVVSTDRQGVATKLFGYGMMAINNLIWLVLLAYTLIRLWNNKKEEFSMNIIFAMTYILGMMAVLLLAEVMNKYSLSAMLALVYIIGGNLKDEQN